MRVRLHLTDGDIKQALLEIDKDRNGTIDLKEYYKYMKCRTNKDILYRVMFQLSLIRKDFQQFDEDGSGFITRDELLKIINVRNGFELSEEDVQLLDGLDKGKRFGPDPDNFDF